jgi:molybdate transport system regulatory protein
MPRSAAAKKSKKGTALLIGLRVISEGRGAFGPGKAELLRRVAETGSLRAAAKDMKMSYMKAWRLAQAMNDCFAEPLILTERGGRTKGGSTVTATGQQVLEDYLAMEASVQRAAQPSWKKLSRQLKLA